MVYKISNEANNSLFHVAVSLRGAKGEERRQPRRHAWGHLWASLAACQRPPQSKTWTGRTDRRRSARSRFWRMSALCLKHKGLGLGATASGSSQIISWRCVRRRDLLKHLGVGVDDHGARDGKSSSSSGGWKQAKGTWRATDLNYCAWAGAAGAQQLRDFRSRSRPWRSFLHHAESTATNPVAEAEARQRITSRAVMKSVFSIERVGGGLASGARATAQLHNPAGIPSRTNLMTCGPSSPVQLRPQWSHWPSHKRNLRRGFVDRGWWPSHHVRPGESATLMSTYPHNTCPEANDQPNAYRPYLSPMPSEGSRSHPLGIPGYPLRGESQPLRDHDRSPAPPSRLYTWPQSMVQQVPMERISQLLRSTLGTRPSTSQFQISHTRGQRPDRQLRTVDCEIARWWLLLGTTVAV